MDTRKLLLASASVLAMGAILTQAATADSSCVSTGVISGVCNSTVVPTGDLSVSGAIATSGTGIFNGNTNIGLLSNTGSIVSTSTAGVLNGIGRTIAQFDTAGVISGNRAGIANYGGSIGALHVVSGTVTATNGAAFDQALGSTGLLLNDGVIAGTSAGIESSGYIDRLNNNGIITGGTALALWSTTLTGGSVVAGSIGNIGNSGTISGNFTGIGSHEHIGTLTNYGVISGGDSAIALYTRTIPGGTVLRGGIDLLVNSGTILVGSYGIQNNGVIGSIANTGLITGGTTDINNWGTIGVISNTGTIASSGSWATGIYNGNSGLIGTLTNSGLISVTASEADVDGLGIWNGGTVGTLINDGIIAVTAAGGAHGVENDVALKLFVNTGTISVTGGTAALALQNQGTPGAQTFQVGGVVNATATDGIAVGIGNGGPHNIGTLGTLSITGVVTATDLGTTNGSMQGINYAAYGIANLAGSQIAQIINTGTVTATSANGVAYGLYNLGQIGTLANSGTINGLVAVDGTGHIGTLTNSGSISGLAIWQSTATLSGTVYTVGGQIDTLNNQGTIGTQGIYNAGTIGSFQNAGTIVGSGTIVGIKNANVIRDVSNSGYIDSIYNYGIVQGTDTAINQWFNVSGDTATPGTIGAINNNGTIVGTNVGIANPAYIGTITNNGVISGGGGGISNWDGTFTVGTATTSIRGTIGTLVNLGIITGGSGADIWNSGVFGAIYNPTGTIAQMIGNVGTIGTLVSSGSINGIGNWLNTTTDSQGSVISYAYGTIGELHNVVDGSHTGTLSGGVNNSGYIGLIDNSGLINGQAIGNFQQLVGTIVAGGTIGAIVNSGTIQSTGTALLNAGTIGTVTNSGLIAGFNAIVNTVTTVNGTVVADVIDTLVNTGTIKTGTVATAALINKGLINTVLNEGQIRGVQNSGNIGTVTNTGLIGGLGLVNQTIVSNGTTLVGTIGAILNSGTIIGVNSPLSDGITNYGVVGTIVNDGVLIGGTTVTGSITNYYAGIYTNGTVGGITNNGTLGGFYNSVQFANGSILQGTLGSFVNTGTVGSSTVAGTGFASGNSGVIGTFVNTGVFGPTSSGIAFTNNTASTTSTINGTITRTLAPGIVDTLRNDGTFAGLVNYGRINNLTNTGLLWLPTTNGYAVTNYATINSLTNSGTIDSLLNGYSYNTSNGTLWSVVPGYIGAIDNSGTILDGIDNSRTIGTITNSGLIHGPYTGIANYWSGNSMVGVATQAGTIAAIINTGTIAGGDVGIYNSGIIDTVDNQSLITGGETAINNNGTIGVLTNSGTLLGKGDWSSAIYNENGGVIGTLTNSGLISATATDANSDSYGVWNGDSTIGTFTNTGTITATGNALADAFDNKGALSIFVNGGTISVSSPILAIGIENEGTLGAGTIIAGGAITASAADGIAAGIVNGNPNDVGILGVLNITGVVTATDAGTSGGGTLGVSAGAYGVYNFLNSTIGQLTNSGTINATSANLGSYGYAVGIYNLGTIGSLENDGVINTPLSVDTGAGNFSYGIYSPGSVGKIINNGTITAAVGISGGNNYGSAFASAEITNNGVINGYWGGIDLGGTIGAINNTGTILVSSDSAWGINFSGTVGTLTNSGTIVLRADHDSGYEADALVSNGTTGALINSGLIDIQANGQSGYAIGIVSAGTIGVLRNEGTILLNAGQFGEGIEVQNAGSVISTGLVSINAGIAQGVYVTYGTIGALSLAGTIAVTGSGFAAGIYNGANTVYSIPVPMQTITNLSISGAVTVNATGALKLADMPSWYSGDGYAFGAYGIANGANSSIGTLVNDGIITATSTNGVAYGLYNAGTVGNIANSGTISAADAIYSTGSLGTITNSGVIAGNVTSATDLVIAGGANTAGTFSGGTITATGVTFTGGSLALGDNIVAGGGSGTVANTGATLSLNSVISIAGNYTQTSGVLSLVNSGELLVSGTASISGGTVALATNNNYAAGSQVTLVGASDGSSYNGVSVTLTGLDATADTTSTKDLVITVANAYVGGSLGSLTNSGTISSQTGVFVASGGTVGSISNDGTITGTLTGVDNSGSIGTFDNGGTLGGSGTGVDNSGSIGTFSNGGTISLTGGDYGVNNSGTLGELNNGGTITGSNIDVYNDGSIGSLVNDGHIGSNYAVYIATGGVLGQFVNNGDIEGQIAAFYNAGSVGPLTNGGTITGGSYALFNSGTLGPVTNSGLITGTGYAIFNTGTLGLITNSGVINGNISSTSGLSIAGGTGVLGTLTGGTITAPTVEFTTGSIALGDVVAGDAINSGSNLKLVTGAVLNGAYTQTAGVLDLTSYGPVTIASMANISGGTVAASLAATGNYLAGQGTTLIDAATGSSYSGATVNVSGATALTYATSNVNGDLVVSYLNDYVGGTLASATNAGTISGNDYGLLVAASGSLGAFANSGTLAGNSYAIYSAGALGPITDTGLISGNIYAANSLTIAGGSGTTGTLSGGTITTPTVNFTSGSLVLSDAVAGNAANTGATLKLGTGAAFGGNYAQSAGVLDLTSFGTLTVTGTASITGGTVAAALASTGNYLAGQSKTVIDGASGSTYTGETISISGATGLAITSSSSNGDLIINYANDYVGGSLATIANTGTISGNAYAVYVASTGSLGGLSNTGTLSGSAYAVYSAGNLGPITNAGVISGNISSTKSLSIAGGTSGSGTLTGGTITAPSVSFTSGSIKLADAVNVGTGTVTASSATIEVASKVSITGNYVQTGGVLISDVASSSSYGQLAVSGSATVTGAAITLSGSTVKAGETYTIIDATGASSYSGDTISIVGAHYKAQVTATADDLIATIRPLFSDIGKAKGGDAVTLGGVLEGLSGVNAMKASIDKLSNLSDANLGVALLQEAPAQVGNGAATLRRALLTTGAIGDAINRHVSGIDQGATGSTFWLAALGGIAQRDAAGSTQAYDTTVAGFVAGWDDAANRNLRVGIAASWANGWNSAKGDVSANTNGAISYQVTGYAAWSNGAWSLNSHALLGYDNYHQHRVLSYLGEVADGNYAGHHYGLSAEGGYTYGLGTLTLTPTASINWLHIGVGGYTETGAGADDLTLRSYRRNQAEGQLGFKLGAAANTSLGFLAPELKVAWVHDFVGGAPATDAYLGGSSFQLFTDPVAADGLKVGAGLTLLNGGGVSLRVGYDGDIRRDYKAHTGDVQLQFRF